MIHTMASKIQRFWYAHARWTTTRRNGQSLISSGLDIQEPSKLTEALGSDKVLRLFTLWLRRFLPKSNEAPDPKHVLSAFSVCAYRLDFADPVFTSPRDLTLAAIALVQSMDTLLREPNPTLVPPMLQCMNDYLLLYHEWRAVNVLAVRQRLLQLAVTRALRLMTSRIQPNPDTARDRSIRMALFMGGMDELTKLTQSSPELKVIARLTSSSFWGPGDASVFKMMHEALMDERFTLEYETVCVRFRTKYQSIPTHKMPEFLVDMRAIVMFPLRNDAIITEMTRLLDFESSPFRLRECAEQLLPLIIKATPNPTVAQRIAAAWEGCDRALLPSILEVMREAACSLRYAYALVDLDHCQRSVRRHPAGFHHTHADMLISRSTNTKYTEAWIQRTLCGHPLLGRLAEGDPFALIRFHDHEIMRFALAGDFTPPVPEVLQFDVERMRALLVDNQIPAERLMEMVDTHEIPENTPLYVKENVASLRRMVYVCRFQHGERLSEIIQRLAGEMVRKDG